MIQTACDTATKQTSPYTNNTVNNQLAIITSSLSYGGLSCYGSHPQYANMSTYVARLIDITDNNKVMKTYQLVANGNVGGSGSYEETWIVEFEAGHTYKLEAVNTYRHPDIVSYEGYMAFNQSIVVCDLK